MKLIFGTDHSVNRSGSAHMKMEALYTVLGVTRDRHEYAGRLRHQTEAQLSDHRYV